jgi:hypothetical protein
LAPVLIERAAWSPQNPEPELSLSYRAMRRFAGLGTDNSVNQALNELEEIGFLERLGDSKRTDLVLTGGKVNLGSDSFYKSTLPIRETARYRLTPFSKKLIDRANDNRPQFAAAISQEKQTRKKERDRREQVLKSQTMIQ